MAPKDWADLEVTKRSVNIGTAGVLDLPEGVVIPPGATGKATVTWKNGGRNDRILKDRSLHETTILTVDTIKIDVKSIDVPEPDPTLFDKDGKPGDIATAGEAVEAAKNAIDRKRQAAGERDDDQNGDDPGPTPGPGMKPHRFKLEAGTEDTCSICGEPSGDPVHVNPAQATAAKKRTTGGPGKSTARTKTRS